MPKEQQYSIDIISALTERTIRRLWVTIILLLVLLVGTNAGWIYYESQFSTEKTVIEATTDDTSTAIVANDNSEVSFVGGQN